MCGVLTVVPASSPYCVAEVVASYTASHLSHRDDDAAGPPPAKACKLDGAAYAGAGAGASASVGASAGADAGTDVGTGEGEGGGGGGDDGAAAGAGLQEAPGAGKGKEKKRGRTTPLDFSSYRTRRVAVHVRGPVRHGLPVACAWALCCVLPCCRAAVLPCCRAACCLLPAACCLLLRVGVWECIRVEVHPHVWPA